MTDSDTTLGGTAVTSKLHEPWDKPIPCRQDVFKTPPVEWIKHRLEHLHEVLEQRTAHSAQALRTLLGPIRMDLVTPDIGRPFYRAVTTLDTLALIETPSGTGAEGGSNSLQRWRRRESNPRPRSRKRWRLRA